MIRAMSSLVIVVAVASVTAIAMAQKNPTTQPGYRIEETQLGPYFIPMEDSVDSADGLHTCQVVTEAVYRWHAGPGPNNLPKRMRVYLDGQPGPEFDSIIKGSLKLSPDGRHVAYAAIDKDQQWVVRGDKATAAYDGAIVFSLTFSPDSQKLAYAVKKGNRSFVVLDGQAQEQFDDIFGDTIAFSPDSHRLSYFAENGKERLVVVDGKSTHYEDWIEAERPIRYGQPFPPNWPSGRTGAHVVFSPDSKHVAYVSRLKSQDTLMEDGVAVAESAHIGSITFSPDSRHLAFINSVTGRNENVLIIDGKQVGSFFDRIFGPVFSSDSEHLGFTAWKNKKSYVFTDGVAGPPYETTPLVRGISLPIFSPDSKRVAYVAQSNGKRLVVADGKPSAAFDQVIRPLYSEGNSPEIIFSPDSQHIAFVASKNNKFIVVRDGVAGTEYESIAELMFSPDSSHLIYRIFGDKCFVVVDEHPLTAYGAEWGHLMVSPDSKHTACYAQLPSCEYAMTIDGNPGPSFHSIIGINQRFNADGSLEYLAERDQLLYRVKHIPLQ